MLRVSHPMPRFFQAGADARRTRGYDMPVQASADVKMRSALQNTYVRFVCRDWTWLPPRPVEIQIQTRNATARGWARRPLALISLSSVACVLYRGSSNLAALGCHSMQGKHAHALAGSVTTTRGQLSDRHKLESASSPDLHSASRLSGDSMTAKRTSFSRFV